MLLDKKREIWEAVESGFNGIDAYVSEEIQVQFPDLTIDNFLTDYM